MADQQRPLADYVAPPPCPNRPQGHEWYVRFDEAETDLYKRTEEFEMDDDNPGASD